MYRSSSPLRNHYSHACHEDTGKTIPKAVKCISVHNTAVWQLCTVVSPYPKPTSEHRKLFVQDLKVPHLFSAMEGDGKERRELLMNFGLVSKLSTSQRNSKTPHS